ncbi:MAG TPA: DNA methyltransferase [Candidatus Acidoferrum sp.]|nr:DNA methyltransferase [Candidatus Acidoferrum sp.]
MGAVQTVIDISKAHVRILKNGLPYYKPTEKEKLEELRELLRHGPARIVDGEVTQTMHAQGFCWSYHPHSWEVRCNGKLTPMEISRDYDKLWEALEERALYGSVRSLTDSEVRKGLSSATGAQGVSGFRPSAAWAIYDLYCRDNATVYDPSAGWGGRLVGALACKKVRKYIACEPATKTFAGLKRMKADLHRLVPQGRLQVEMHRVGSEDFAPEPSTVDCVLWSPPYFEGDGVVEEYSDEKTQSHVRFPAREAWLSGYLATTLANVYAALKPGGTLALNVSDAMKPDAAALAAREGFALVREMRYALSRIIGNKHQGPKSEPILIFAKETTDNEQVWSQRTEY